MRHRLHAATVKANELRPRLDGFGIGPLHFACLNKARMPPSRGRYSQT
jgi:hypothetical protein